MSVRGLIVDNIKTTLEGITTGAGYSQTIAYVSTDSIELPETLSPDSFPACFVIDTEERKEVYDVDSVKCTLNIIILSYLRRASDATNLQNLRRNLINDIEKALMVDESRGGYAIFTFCRKVETDNGIDDNNAYTEMTFEIEYYHNRQNPSSQDNSPGI